MKTSQYKESGHAHGATAGFTLAETLVVIAITGILMVSVTLLFKDVFVDSRQEFAASNTIDQGRLMAANFINEMRNATSGVDGSFPLNQAGNSQLIFFTNYHTGGTVDRIRYFISGTSLYKGVTPPTGTPPIYDTSSNESISDVLDNVTNGTGTPAFYYYNGLYSGSSGSPLTQPVNVNTVTFVKLNLNLLKQDVTGGTATFAVNDGATIRSLKTNLGN